mgnify:CR=1 FL=1
MNLIRNIKKGNWLCFITLVFCTTLVAQNKNNSRPNIIVILTDDMGYADLDIQGSLDDLKTPHLNDLAETGVRMSAGYVTASQCMPSRAGLLSGRYQQRFGLDHNGTIPFPLEEEMIAQRMKDAGYVTGMSGKWHLEPNRNHHNWINTNIPEIAGRKKYNNEDVPHALKIPYLPNNKGFDFVHEGRFNQYWATHNVDGELIEPALINIPGYRLEVQTESAVTFIDKFKDEPFFYFLSYYAPHVPLDATEKYLSRFPGDMPERRRMCLAMIAAMDDGIGRIKETLRKNNIEENTLIIFLSDNGAPLKLHKKDVPLSFKGGAWNGSLNDPYIGEKGMVSEGGVRVPFIMNWPNGLPKGKVYDRPVSSLDIAATSLAIAGEKVPKELDGVNVIPYLNGETKGDPHDALYWRFWQQAAIRVGDWKYLNYQNTEFLFNVYNDEHEHVNLIGKYPNKAKELKANLTQWGSELKHPGISMKDAPAPKEWLTHYFYESLPKE